METIIAASSNAHKIKEIQAIMDKFGIKVVSRDEAGVPPFEIEEDGRTFEENSYKKAAAIMKVTGKTTIADDSGLMVDYLGGAPGVYSARFAGEEHDDVKNNEKLSAEIGRIAEVAGYLWQKGWAQSLVARGECEGRIIGAPVGENGFGYDPLFVPDGYDRTFAQFTEEEKNAVSHRARALQKLEELLGES